MVEENAGMRTDGPTEGRINMTEHQCLFISINVNKQIVKN